MNTDQTKIVAMVEWPQTKNIGGIKRIFGFNWVLQKVYQDYAKISKPLTNLLKKGEFLWNPEADQAFNQLTSLVLALPDFTKLFILKVDACNIGIGAVLMQGRRPLAFMSQNLSKKHQEMSTYEKKLIALLQVVDKWRHYL